MNITQNGLQNRFFLIFFFLITLHLIAPYQVQSAEQLENKYVGVDACIDCHEDIVKIYKQTSGKASSNESVLKMREKLTEAEFQECLSCHTTGYGEPTGFVSFEKTPHLAVVGCESCHGMGYLHTIEQSAESISVKPTLELCTKCHDDSKITRILFDGRIHAGGH